MSVARPAAVGRTRACPHCKATILESASVCPGCQHHLRFDSEAQKQAAARSAFKVEGKIQHPLNEDPWEYCVVVSVKNEKGEEVARNVVNVGALQMGEKRTFSLSVDVMPQKRKSG
jgi:hypothetical protein